MKINWKLRLQNKVTLTALVILIIAFVYQMLALFGITPSASENSLVDLAKLGIDILVGIGIVVDPTTAGVSDSTNAMNYEEPKSEK